MDHLETELTVSLHKLTRRAAQERKQIEAHKQKFQEEAALRKKKGFRMTQMEKDQELAAQTEKEARMAFRDEKQRELVTNFEKLLKDFYEDNEDQIFTWKYFIFGITSQLIFSKSFVIHSLSSIPPYV